MGIRFRALLPLPIVFILASCGSGDLDAGRSAELYRQAHEHSRKGEYRQALEAYSRGLEGADLSAPTPGVVGALDEKRRLEGLVGSYADAFATADRLLALPEGSLEDSLRTGIVLDRSRWLGELGRFDEAAEELGALADPSSGMLLLEASLALRAGLDDRAESIYRELAERGSDALMQMRGWSGLMQCRASRPGATDEALEPMARRVVALSGRVMSMKGRPVERLQALRHGAAALQLTLKHRRDASFLLFRALSIANGEGGPFLREVLRLESNAAIVRKVDPFRESASYFEMKNMPYGRAMALFMLSQSDGADAAERTHALEDGFAAARDAAPPWPRRWMRELEAGSLLRLNGLLLEQSRIFELFDALQQSSMLNLSRSLIRRADRFRAEGASADTVAATVRSLLQDMGGLRQRKAEMLAEASGEERRRAADRSLNMKHGQLLELLSGLRTSCPVASEALSLNPVTLRTVQHALRDDEAVLAPVFSDSAAALLVIGRRSVQVARAREPFVGRHSAASLPSRLHRELASAVSADEMHGGEWEWFVSSMGRPAAEALKSYRQVIIVSDMMLPLHLVKGVGDPSSERRVSYLHSFRELVILRSNSVLPPGSSEISFYDAPDPDGPAAHKMFSPRDRVFITWKPFSEEDLEGMKREIGEAMQETVSGSVALQALRRSDPGKWSAVSAYGVQ
ncbi:hypothetical protein [Chlorobium sp. N1]|uniref:hypothetical protein n=1 Tax=Chlorobium sp. N1 TaxID=2491138 RepID=UPI00103D52DA|nr:hypothetical protein [Chlorobium sp. N1]TCD47812.1 hypothetical protein E0L29_05905 [Chlorobium sp. N1]